MEQNCRAKMRAFNRGSLMCVKEQRDRQLGACASRRSDQGEEGMLDQPGLHENDLKLICGTIFVMFCQNL